MRPELLNEHSAVSDFSAFLIVELYYIDMLYYAFLENATHLGLPARPVRKVCAHILARDQRLDLNV